MFNISPAGVATIYIDVIALFFLIGMVITTSLYRRRGRLSDRLFFAMLFLDFVIAITDSAEEVFSGSLFSFSPVLTLLFANILWVAFQTCCFLMTLYFFLFMKDGERIVREKWRYLALPAAVGMLLLIVNLFSGFLFYVDPITNVYTHAPAFPLVFMVAIVYAVPVCIVLRRVNRRSQIAFLVAVCARIILEWLFPGLSSNAFFIAVVLAYGHEGAMNRPFYEENA